MFGDKSSVPDPEDEFRFYKSRDLTRVSQSQWMYEVFKESMNIRIQAAGMITVLYMIVSCYYYTIIILD